jgi:cyclic pyranopterin phosphate synthase
MSDAAQATVISANTSTAKGTSKTPAEIVELQVDSGITGDAHAGPGVRQVSLLSLEAIDRMRAAGADVDCGSFAENLTVSGIDPAALPLGTHISVGPSAVLVITQHGKECHDRCAIFEQVGDCVMPREGTFAAVARPGMVRPGDTIRVVGNVHEPRESEAR